LKEELENTLGFNIGDAITILDGIENLSFQKLFDRRAQAKNFEKQFKKVVKSYRRKKRISKISGDYPNDLLKELASLRPSESAEKISSLAISWAFYDIGDTLSFTTEELGDFTQVGHDKVNSFLDKFSIQFGEVEDRYRLPAPTHPLMTRPIIQHEDRFFCPVIQAAYHSLRLAIEGFLNPDSETALLSDNVLWNKYNQQRADYLEDKSTEYLSRSLKYAKAYRRLKYRVTNENGEEIEAELDGLLTLDNAIFLLEAKSGSISLSTRRGAPKRLMKELRELVEEAYSQARRAKNYIAQTEKPTFKLENGDLVELEKERYDQIFLVTVSLENLDVFVTNVYQLLDLGFLNHNDFPWAVSLTDLRVISEIMELSCELVHYIKRRIHLNELGWVQAHDELDWLGHYLLEGIYFNDMREPEDSPFIYNLLTYSWVIDDYYFYITGQRQKPVEKPSQPMPQVMRDVLLELDTKHNEGYLDAACALLDMSGKNREELFDYCQKFRLKTLNDREIHDITIPFSKAGFGITFIFTPFERSSEFPNRLISYCNMKKYQTKIDRWIGIACIADTPGWIDYSIVIDGAWAHDDELEELVNKYLPPLPVVENQIHGK